MEMMDSANLPFAQSTSEVDNGFNRWNAPLFKVALCPPDARTLFLPDGSASESDRRESRLSARVTSEINGKETFIVSHSGLVLSIINLPRFSSSCRDEKFYFFDHLGRVEALCAADDHWRLQARVRSSDDETKTKTSV